MLSIQESGQLVPLLVRPVEDGKYEIISGHRRKNALQRAGMLRAECDIVEMTDEQAYQALMVTNIQAQSLSELEEAEGIKHMIDSFEWTQDRAAKEFGKTKMWVSYRLSLLGLSDEVKESVNARLLTVTHAREIAQLPQEQQPEVAKKVVEEKLSTRETADLVKQFTHPKTEVSEPVINLMNSSPELTDNLSVSEPKSQQDIGSEPTIVNLSPIEPELVAKKEISPQSSELNDVDKKRIERAHDYLLALENFIVDVQPIHGVIETLVELGRAYESIQLIDRINEKLQFARLHIQNASTKTEGAKGEVVEFRRKDA